MISTEPLAEPFDLPRTSGDAAVDPYFYRRAEAELARAEAAEHPAVVKAHYQLAGLYLDRFYGGGDGADALGLTLDSQSLPGDPRGGAALPGENR